MKEIVYFYRRRRLGANHSVERVFKGLSDQLGTKYRIVAKTVPFYSNGVLRRLGNAIYVMLNQGDINHITGDINYVAILGRKRKMISTILDVRFLKENSGLKKLILKYFWVYLPIIRSARVTVISNATKKEILSEIGGKFSHKIDVVHIPVNTGFKFSNHAKSGNKFTILQIGGAPNKNLNRLIQSVIGLNVHLLLVGKLTSVNIELLSNVKVSYENFVDVDDFKIIELYKQTDILYFASTYEGFGMPILEAQATGRPVITSNILSMPEVAGEAAVLVDPYSVDEIRNAVMGLMTNSELRNDLIRLGLENVKRFNRENIALKYQHIYNSIKS